MKLYLKFMNSIDLRELHVVVKQGLSNDFQDTQPLRKKGKKQQKKMVRFYFVFMNLRAGGVDSYCGEDKTLGPRVSHLNLLQCSHYCFHFSGMASLRITGRKN